MTKLVLQGGTNLAKITGARGVGQWRFDVGALSEYSFPVRDVDGALEKAHLLQAGTVLTAGDEVMQVAAIEREYLARNDVQLTFQVRSRLARLLKSAKGPHAEKRVTPADWIVARVKEAGGTAEVEPGAKARHIVQKREQSVLDVIRALAQQTEVEWVEHSNRFIVGTPWWAYNGGPKLPTWPLTVGHPAVLGFSSRASLDDPEQSAESQLRLTPAVGQKLRPWHRVMLKGAGDKDAGLWLVKGVSWDDRPDAVVDVSLYRPHHTLVKKASSSTHSATGEGSLLKFDASSVLGSDEVGKDGWIPGANRVWPHCTRSPRQYVKWAQSRVGTAWGYHKCLAFVSTVVSGGEGRGGDYARYVWERRPAGTMTWPHDFSPPCGAICVWGTGLSSAGHIAVSIGGGKMITTTDGSPGIDIWPIRRYTSGYYGAMVPHFYC